MPTTIHPTAVVETGAQLGEGVVLGAYAYVGPHVVLGDRTVLHHHACVEGHTTLGRECEIFPFTCIGTKTQDLKHRGGAPRVRIGDRNVFREYVSIHTGTNEGETVLGNNNLLLAYCHVAHDCILGSHIIASNSVGLAGHVVVEDHVVLGAKSGVHQFCRIGAFAMLGAMSKLVQDIPPYLIADGNPAIARSLNKVGLERAGFTPAQMDAVKAAHRIFYRSGLNASQALEQMAAAPQASAPEFVAFLDFVKKSERGVVSGK